jgi:hypothetical protein
MLEPILTEELIGVTEIVKVDNCCPYCNSYVDLEYYTNRINTISKLGNYNIVCKRCKSWFYVFFRRRFVKRKFIEEYYSLFIKDNDEMLNTNGK